MTIPLLALLSMCCKIIVSPNCDELEEALKHPRIDLGEWVSQSFDKDKLSDN
jgi:hypothetical protein